MTEVKNTKVTANVTSSSDKEQVEYVTFWGQLKGNLEKQTDLSKALSAIKRSINDLSTKYLRKQDKLTPGDNIAIEKNSEDDLVINGPTHTSQLVNDENGDASSEGLFIPFTTLPEVEEVLEPIKTDISALEESDVIINETLETKQNNLTAGEGIELVDDIISVKLDSVLGDGNLIIKKNDVTIRTFNANQDNDTEVNIEVSPSDVLIVTATIVNSETTLDVDFFEISKAISEGKAVIVKVHDTNNYMLNEYMYLSKNRSYVENNVTRNEFIFSNLEFNNNSNHEMTADYIVLIINSTSSSFIRIPLTIAKR